MFDICNDILFKRLEFNDDFFVNNLLLTSVLAGDTHKSDDPVSKITENFCGGVPISIGTPNLTLSLDLK